MNAQPTPMMAQYLEIKSNYPDALLFYRMGDFYELFFEDAKIAAEILDITLTHRGKHLGEEIPMCGVPVHSSESYLHNLIKTGRHVAICEQVEDPAEAKKRGAKSVVKREVVRLVTPGTLTEDNLLNRRAHNFLAAFVSIREEEALAWADISTGAFFVTRIEGDIAAQLASIAPNELIIPDGMEVAGLSEYVPHISPIARSSFEVASSEDRLCRLYGVASLDGFANFGRAEIAAMGGIADYLALTQIEARRRLRPPIRIQAGQHMQIDHATRRNLELFEALSGGRKGALIDVIDKTRSAIGARRFEARLKSPLCDLDEANRRLGFIDAVLAHIDQSAASEALGRVPDFERAFTRLMIGRGSPRDLRMIGDGVHAAVALAQAFANSGQTELERAKESLTALADFVEPIRREIVENPPVLMRDGGFVAEGVFEPLDEMRNLRDGTRQVIAETQRKYVELSGISALKIKYNNVLGYFIETPATHSKHMLSEQMSPHFVHRQTTANALRFSSPELADLEARILRATDDAVAFEKGVFESWLEKLTAIENQIAELADIIGEIDIALSMGRLAEMGWTRPRLYQDSRFHIEDGRHPVVEAAVLAQGEEFIANSCRLEENPGALWLITGPNMAGKSTYLRQNAIITILAQCGFYVPAAEAEIGLVDKIFSRIGAADDLARGRSTFMVEMIETAAILNQSTDKSLVILDEIGRGTATFDGLAIAWSVLEYLLTQNRCRGLFATHFHELTELQKTYPMLHSAHVAIREWQGDVIFLHEIRSGRAERSYGVDVAKLAGLPEAVVGRARQILERLEDENKGEALDDLPLFQMTSSAAPTRPSETLTELRALDPDFMTPREALDALYQLIEKARSEK